jgi:hypothetical protein
MSGAKRLIYSVYLQTEAVIERIARAAAKLEPEWSRRHPFRLWFPVVTMLSFVFVDNFRPADSRCPMKLTTFEVDYGLTLKSLFFSATKIPHISYFFLLYLFLRKIWGDRGDRGDQGGRGEQCERRILVFILSLTVLIELQQGFTAGRDARPLDVLPNLIGLWFGRRYLKDREQRKP